MSDSSLLIHRPIQLQGFTFTATGVDPVGDPSIEEWEAALQFAAATHDASPFWVGALIVYAEDRREKAGQAAWRARVDQIIEVTGLSFKTIKNLASIYRHTSADARALAPSISHAAEVASLVDDDQKAWLDKAKTEGWTKRDLRLHLRAAQRPRVLEGQARLEGKYRVLYADPPWSYRDSGPTPDGSLGKAERHYPTMALDQIMEMPVAAHAMADSVLFLWVPAPLLPDALKVMEAWSFVYKSNIVWDKVLGNFGHYVRVHHEHLLIGTRGSCLPDEPTPQPDSVQVLRRSEEHSAKPEEMRAILDKLYTQGPKLELFARRAGIPGWDCWGNDARLIQTPKLIAVSA